VQHHEQHRKRLVGGGLLGGGLGTLVGAAVGRPLAGPPSVAGLGAGVGGLAGASEDRAEKREEIRQTAAVNAANQAAQQAAARAPRLDEIVTMTRNGVPEANIINEIRNSGAIYNLTSDDIIYLTSNGVTSNVISELQSRYPRRVYATEQVIYTRPGM